MSDKSERDKLASTIRAVTDLWDEPLDEVHDIPPIVNAILAKFIPEHDREIAERAWREGQGAGTVAAINFTPLEPNPYSRRDS